MLKELISIILVSASFWFPRTVFSDVKLAEAVCAKISAKINATMKDDDLAFCAPASYTKGGSTDLFLIMAKKNMRDEETKRTWLVAVVLSSAWAIAELPEMHQINVKEILTGDQRGKLNIIVGVEYAKGISEGVKHGEIKTVDEIYEKIMKLSKR